MVAAVVVVCVILVALALTLWPGAGSTTGPSGLANTNSASTVGMGNLRAVDIVNSSSAGMGDLRAAEALGGPTIGMGDLRADRMPASATQKAPYVGMGDVHSLD